MKPSPTLSISLLLAFSSGAGAMGQSDTGAAAGAPARPALFAGGVPEQRSSVARLRLSLEDAVRRGLEHNLAVLLASLEVEAARGRRIEARSATLPQLSAGVPD